MCHCALFILPPLSSPRIIPPLQAIKFFARATPLYSNVMLRALSQTTSCTEGVLRSIFTFFFDFCIDTKIVYLSQLETLDL